MELASSFLPYFLLMKRKIKINRKRSVLHTASCILFLFLFLLLQENISYSSWFPYSSKSKFNGRNFWRMVKIHHQWNRERKVGTNLGTRILCADSQIHREDSRCRAIEATKKGTKWRNKFRSGPKLETRIPLLGHYCPEYSPPPSPHSTTRGVLLRFNFPRFASVPKIFLSFLRYSFFFFFISKKKWTYFL